MGLSGSHKWGIHSNMRPTHLHTKHCLSAWSKVDGNSSTSRLPPSWICCPQRSPTENTVTKTTFKVNIASHRLDHGKPQCAPGNLVMGWRTNQVRLPRGPDSYWRGGEVGMGGGGVKDSLSQRNLGYVMRWPHPYWPPPQSPLSL